MKDAFENSFKENLDNFELPYDASAWSAMQAKLDATAAAGSNSIDQQVKESLSGNEYPYNPAAWTAMSKKLDAKKGGKGKWFVAASILALVSVGTYLALTSNSDQKQEPTPTKTVQTSEVNTKENKSIKSNTGGTSIGIATDENSNQIESTEKSNPSSQKVATNQQNAQNTNQPSNNVHTNNQNAGGSSGEPNPTSHQTQSINDQSSTSGQEVRIFNYISPEIGDICYGTIEKIKNDNDFPLIIMNPNGQVWKSAEKTQTSFNPTIAGIHRVGYMKKNRFIEKEQFVVNPEPKADFEFTDLSKIYLDGLPTTEVRTASAGQSFTWEYENGVEFGTEAELHFYKKGIHVIELSVVGSTGCEATVRKTVNIDENYNLMAISGFYPMGIDPRTNVFMPYSLTKRDVQFTMIILDPNDGHLIYETSDASKGWDGVDRQTGSLVQLEKVYIWKVTLNNPEKGESSEYAGTIMPLSK